MAEQTRARIYIAGPMRGYLEHNFPAFRRAAAAFAALGWETVSPVDIGQALFGNQPDVPGGEYIRADVKALADCSAIALLDGWERSTGARCEAVVALTIGLQFYDAASGEPMDAPSRIVCDGGYERAAGAVDTLDGVVEDILAWQCQTFTKRTPHSITAHLLREAAELHAAPSDNEEWADVVFLAVALIQDGTPDAPRDLIGALRAKLAKNQRRVWGVPDADGVVEHLAEGVL